MDKLFIFDGSSLLNQAFYGTLPGEYFRVKTEEEKEEILNNVLRTSSGAYVNGVFTMVKIFLNFINTYHPTHVAVCWDISRNTFRKKLYPEYKGTRDETKIQLKEQFITMQKLLRQMNIPQFMDSNFEADDFIGSLAKRFEKKIPVYLITKDQDALQLVNDYTRLWYYKTTKADAMYKELGINEPNVPKDTFEFTPMYVEYFYGVSPRQIPDYKALIGDTSDNIPGVNGLGEKSVVPLLQEYGDIETIYDQLEEYSRFIDEKPPKNVEKQMKELWKALGISNPLKKLFGTDKNGDSNKDLAYLSKELAVINTDIQAVSEVFLDDLLLIIDKAGMYDGFKELEFKSLLKDVS